MFVSAARLGRKARFGLCALAIVLAGCASNAMFTKEQLETALNDELTTGAGPDEIQAFFKRHDEGGHSFVFNQPKTEDEVSLCMEALEGSQPSAR